MPPVLSEAMQIDAPEAADLTQPLVGVLQQLRDVVTTVNDRQYRQHPVGPVESSIGGHVRHCLDHINALVNVVQGRSRVLNYDRRERGTPIESDRRAALERIADLQDDLAGLLASPDESVQLCTLLSPDQPPIETPSSVGRELSFVLSHTIHHNALIATMLKLLGCTIPQGLGLAPSTLAYRASR